MTPRRPRRGWPIVMLALAAAASGVGGRPAAATVVAGSNGPIVFHAFTSSGTVIYTKNADNSGFREIGPGKEASVNPADGSFAYVRDGLAVMNADGSAPTVILRAEGGFSGGIDGPGIANPSWSPDGQRIVFWSASYQRSDVYSIGRDGRGLTRLFYGDPTTGRPRDPLFSPDGTSIVSWANVFGQIEGKIFLYDVQTRQNRPLADGRHPRWSPDGRSIVYEAMTSQAPACRGDVTGTEVYALELRTGLKHQLTRTPPFTATCEDGRTVTFPGSAYLPILSPDGRNLLFRRSSGAGTGLYETDTDGSEPVRSPLTAQYQQGTTFPDEITDWTTLLPQLRINVLDGLPSDAHSHLLTRASVELLQDDVAVNIPYERTAYGSLNFMDVPPGAYTVRAWLQDAVGKTFNVQHGLQDPLAGGPAAVWIEKTIFVHAGERAVENIAFSQDELLDKTNLYDLALEDLDDVANTFWQLERFVAWAERRFTPGIRDDDVTVYAFARLDPVSGKTVDQDASYYRTDDEMIVMGTSDSRYTARDDPGDEAPANVEWHEFTHHMWHRRDPLSSNCSPNFVNHGGYANPDTCDSVDEGVAMFMPAVAARELDGAVDGHYAWDVALEHDYAAFSGDGTEEDFAVAALLWDLYDEGTESRNRTLRRSAPGERAYFAATITDDSTYGLRTLWDLWATKQPMTVVDLRTALVPGSPTRDVDGDGVADLTPLDEVFILHGFYPVPPDEQYISDVHKSWFYDIGIASQLLAFEGARNDGISRTDHRRVPGTTYVEPRYERPQTPRSNVLVRARDAGGRPLVGFTVDVTESAEGSTWKTSAPVPGAEGLVHLEPPAHNRYLQTDGPPACALADNIVSISMTGHAVGVPSANGATFDNCTFRQAVAGATGEYAMTADVTFPEDPDAPFAAMNPKTDGYLSPGWSTTSWTIDVSCTDPAVGGHASYGCLQTEYRVNGAPWQTVAGPVVLTEQGSYTIDAKAVDRVGNQSVSTIVLGIDRTPAEAVDDTYEATEDAMLDVAAPGVLANDSTGAPMTVSLAAGPSFGSLELNGDGSFRYVPGWNFAGTDRFTYMACKSYDRCDDGTATITVLPVDDPPVATDDTYATWTYDTLDVAAPGLTANDSDVEDDVLVARLVRQPDHGTVLIDLDGAFRFTANAGHVGGDSFEYAIDDGHGGSAQATAYIEVRHCRDGEGEGGLDAAAGTPADGAVSHLMQREVETRIAALNPDAAKALRTISCAVLVPTEDRVNDLA